MLLGAEVAMSVLGLYWLITGKAKISKTKELTGTRGRILGLILVLTFPLVFLLGLVIGMLIGMEVLPTSLIQYAFIGDILSIVLVLVAVAVYSSAAGKDQPAETSS